MDIAYYDWFIDGLHFEAGIESIAVSRPSTNFCMSELWTSWYWEYSNSLGFVCCLHRHDDSLLVVWRARLQPWNLRWGHGLDVELDFSNMLSGQRPFGEKTHGVWQVMLEIHAPKTGRATATLHLIKLGGWRWSSFFGGDYRIHQLQLQIQLPLFLSLYLELITLADMFEGNSHMGGHFFEILTALMSTHADFCPHQLYLFPSRMRVEYKYIDIYIYEYIYIP